MIYVSHNRACQAPLPLATSPLCAKPFIEKLFRGLQLNENPVYYRFALTVGIVQLARMPDCGSGGRRFESDYPPQRNLDKKVKFGLA